MGMIDQLKAREEQKRPIRIGMIGGGKFGTMFMAQAQRIPGVHVLGVVATGRRHGWRSLSPGRCDGSVFAKSH